MNEFETHARGVETWDEYQHRDEDHARSVEARRARLEAFWEHERNAEPRETRGQLSLFKGDQ